jgi:L-amino acid N-acyltransferase YncA
MIRSATLDDATGIASIYNHYVQNTVITFEEEAVAKSEMAERIRQGQTVGSWLVAEVDETLLGYTYSAPFAARSAYRKSVETSVYVAHGQRGRGHGSELYGALIDYLRDQNLHCAIGLIALPNQESVSLHEKLGFRNAGELSEVGWKFSKWVNVGYWQLLL